MNRITLPGTISIRFMKRLRKEGIELKCLNPTDAIRGDRAQIQVTAIDGQEETALKAIRRDRGQK